MTKSLRKKISLNDFFPTYLNLIGLNVQVKEKDNFLTNDIEKPRVIYNPNQHKVFYKDLK